MPLSSTAGRCLAVLQLLNEEIVQNNEAANADADISANQATYQNEQPTGATYPLVPDLNTGQQSYFSGEGAMTAPMLPLELQNQDFAWFDSLPTDLLAIDNDQLFNLM